MNRRYAQKIKDMNIRYRSIGCEHHFETNNMHIIKQSIT